MEKEENVRNLYTDGEDLFHGEEVKEVEDTGEGVHGESNLVEGSVVEVIAYERDAEEVVSVEDLYHGDEEQEGEGVVENNENEDGVIGQEDNLTEEEKEREQELERERAERAEELERLRLKQEEVKDAIGEQSRDVNMVSVFEDDEGQEIPARERGKVELKMLNIAEDILEVQRFRKQEDNIHGLQDSIRRYGLLEPIHVVPYGDGYVLLQGYRRLQAYVNLGKTTILAVVDYTVPAELVKYYQVEMNNLLSYKFIEKLAYGKFVEETQARIGTDVIEQSLGLHAGEYLKMKYIDQFKGDFPEIFLQVQNGKLNIDQAYKKIDKEIEKQQKELDQLNVEDPEMDNIKDVDELAEAKIEADQQELGKRKVLDPVIRRSVESRAGGACECCGYGKDEPDLVGVFQAHHIVAVQYGGDDSKGNLVLLCPNCHKLVHDYEVMRFTPDKGTYDRLLHVKRVVVLGNILRIIRKKSLQVLKAKSVETGRQVEKGVLTIGKGLDKAKVKLNWKEEFESTPYDTFIAATENLKYGGSTQGRFSEVDVEGYEDDLEKEE